MTAEEKASYLSEPGECPKCRGGSIVGEPVEILGRSASQECSCPDCGAAWHDIYTLTDVEIKEEGEQ